MVLSHRATLLQARSNKNGRVYTVRQGTCIIKPKYYRVLRLVAFGCPPDLLCPPLFNHFLDTRVGRGHRRALFYRLSMWCNNVLHHMSLMF